MRFGSFGLNQLSLRRKCLEILGGEDALELEAGFEIMHPYNARGVVADLGEREPDHRSGAQFGIGLQPRAANREIDDLAQSAIEAIPADPRIERYRRARTPSQARILDGLEFGSERRGPVLDSHAGRVMPAWLTVHE